MIRVLDGRVGVVDRQLYVRMCEEGVLHLKPVGGAEILASLILVSNCCQWPRASCNDQWSPASRNPSGKYITTAASACKKSDMVYCRFLFHPKTRGCSASLS